MFPVAEGAFVSSLKAAGPFAVSTRMRSISALEWGDHHVLRPNVNALPTLAVDGVCLIMVVAT